MGTPRTGTVVFRSRSRTRCLELWAVLDAAGIDSAIEERRSACFLVVRDEDLPRAVRELDDYRREASRRQPAQAGIPEPLGGGWIGVLSYATILVAVAGFADRQALGSDWFEAGRAQAGLLAGGEWWRALTALTLHVDAEHLMGNLVFGSVLGFLAAQGLGVGVAWLGILVAGGLGNAASALLHTPQHSAVGASTAVFASLGILVALALRHRRARTGNPFQRWSPLVAGALLLVWTGTGGERTDVTAHVAGAAAGLTLGVLCGSIPRVLLRQGPVQVAASALAGVLIAAAWLVALWFNRP